MSVFSAEAKCIQNMQGFIQRGGGPGTPPPRNLQIEYGYYCGAINIGYLILHVIGRTCICHQNVVWKVCPRLCQKQSERI